MVTNTKQHLHVNTTQLVLAQFLVKAKPIAFECDCASHTRTSLACSKCQNVFEKAFDWKTWLQWAETHLIASWVHQVWASDSFSRAFWAGMGFFPCCFLPHELCKAGWERNWTSTAVRTSDCPCSMCTATADDRLWNPRISLSVVAVLPCSLACVKDSLCFFYVLPQRVKSQSD